ncbi:hypothetical protein ACEPPN_004082 [Leptodophora sp. 'Broadleaf-Isolate-01']
MASQNSANATGSGHQSLTSSSSTNAATAIPTSTSFPHKKVLVLLLCWEDEQDGVWGEIIRLETNPDSHFLEKFQEIKEKAEMEESLVILYYGSHGRMSKDKEGKH